MQFCTQHTTLKVKRKREGSKTPGAERLKQTWKMQDVRVDGKNMKCKSKTMSGGKVLLMAYALSWSEIAEVVFCHVFYHVFYHVCTHKSHIDALMGE